MKIQNHFSMTTMKCEIALITAVLLLNTVAFGQFNVADSITVNLSLANNSNDLETAFAKLGVNFNRSAVKTLELRDIYMQSGKPFFKEDHFRQFSSLLILYLKDGKIESFPNGTFENWKNDEYKRLYLINIGLENISEDLLSPISHLSYLIVSHNKLTHLQNNVFNASPSLHALDLSYNQLTHLPRDLFKLTNEVIILRLSNNNITGLEKDVFSGLEENLVDLDLSFNDVQYIHEEVFTGMRQLACLMMSHTFSSKYNSDHLPPKIFGNLSSLWTLEANRNNFRGLPEDIFNDLEKLRDLDLSGNKIEFLSSNIFGNNHYLENLSLDGNKLRYLDSALFRNLTNLQYLNLANNQLANVFHRSEVFSSLYQLHTIILDNNEEIQLAYSGSNSVLYNSKQIRRISARNTSISEIYSDWHSLQYLEVLDVTNTPIGKIQLNYTYPSKIAQLVLTGSSNESLILRNDKMLTVNEDSKYRYILDKNKGCGTNCSCVFYMLYEKKIIRLTCTDFDRGKLEPKIPNAILAHSQSFKIDFILDGCGKLDIHLLVDYMDQIGPEKVRTLSLSHNGLSSISELNQVFPFNLEILALDHNDFTWLDPLTVKNLRNSTSLQKITLHENKWDCACNLRDLIRFVKDIKRTKDEVLCSDKSRLQDYAVENCDPISDKIILFSWCTAVATAILAVGLVVYCRYHFYINSFAYQYHESLPEWIFPDEEGIDMDRIYDAYVCYAHNDEAFVKNKLVHKLEPHFKLCLHQRDWNIGELINHQIYNSVRNSRRTIIVLSHNFLASHWCNIEFEVALNKAIEDRVNRLIVIMLEDIASESLSDIMKAYISRFTYIPWRDNYWFWSKLMYALPHFRRRNNNNNANANRNDEENQFL